MRLIKSLWCALRRHFLFLTPIAFLPFAVIYLIRYKELVTPQSLTEFEELLVKRNEAGAGRFFRQPAILIGKAKNMVVKGTATNKYDYLNSRVQYANTTSWIPIDQVQSLSDPDMKMVEKRMEKRRKHLLDKCAQLGLNVVGNDDWHKPDPWEFLVNRKYHLIWCNVFKSASSSWMFNFNILAGYSKTYLRRSKEVFLRLARARYPRISLDKLREAQNDSITFIIARHPFERLLSAYQDKIVHAVPWSPHDILGRNIVRLFRRKKSKNKLPAYPTFAEFVRWILTRVRRGNQMDMHFVSTTKFCTPCLINFDIIMKFETLEEDQLYLIDKAGLKRIIVPEWRNMGKGKNTLDLLQESYSQLTRRELDGLYEYYKYDFDIFDYSAASYFNIAKANEVYNSSHTAKNGSIEDSNNTIKH